MYKEKISIVVPAFNEAENLPILFSRVSDICSKIFDDYEVIVVDDGSSDNTNEVLRKLFESNPEHIKGLILSRNFGHQAALNAGIDVATGNIVVVMDADLQQPPELIVEMHSKFREGNDIVLAIRRQNKQNNFLREKIGQFFYIFINKVSGLNLQSNVADFGMYSKEVVDVLKQIPEKDRFLRGLVQWVGFRKEFVEYVASERLYGESKYNFRKLARLAVTGITSFSAFPLRLSLWVGFIISFVSFLYGLYIVSSILFFSAILPSGWASIILLISFLGGIQLIILGILGEYVYKVYNEIKGRPLYIVNKQIGLEKSKKSLYGINTEV